MLASPRLGRSVEGRPITAIERGTKAAPPVVVIGVIHGDEDAGTAIVDRLAAEPVPAGIDLWLVPSMNPDGQADGTRATPTRSTSTGTSPGAGPSSAIRATGSTPAPAPASEPETKAMVAFLDQHPPDLVIWYHQDLYRIAPTTGRAGRIRRRYAKLTGLPVLPVTGGTYTGVAAGWARARCPGAVAFIVELGPTLSSSQADTHARAVLSVAAM